MWNNGVFYMNKKEKSTSGKKKLDRSTAPGFDIYSHLWYIRAMDYALKERIGNPDLFTGRKKELDYFLKWINDIKQEKSQSNAPSWPAEKWGNPPSWNDCSI